MDQAEWETRRKTLEDALQAAARDLLDHAGAAAFVSKLKGTNPPVYVIAGDAEQVASAVESLQSETGFPDSADPDIELSVPPGYYWHRYHHSEERGAGSWALIWIDPSGAIEFESELLGRGQEAEIREILNGELVAIQEPPDERTAH